MKRHTACVKRGALHRTLTNAYIPWHTQIWSESGYRDGTLVATLYRMNFLLCQSGSGKPILSGCMFYGLYLCEVPWIFIRTREHSSQVSTYSALICFQVHRMLVFDWKGYHIINSNKCPFISFILSMVRCDYFLI